MAPQCISVFKRDINFSLSFILYGYHYTSVYSVIGELMKINQDVAIKKIDRLCNIFELTGVIAILLVAFIFQILYRELPCPLCLYQRLGFFGIAIGYLLNLRFGFKPSHYAVVILSALYTSFVALRQIALHVVPGTGSYGDPIFGLHLYTWSFIIAMLILASTTLLLSVDRQYTPVHFGNGKFKATVTILFAVTVLLLGLNVATVYLECGFKTCPDNPTEYHLSTR
jgi:disulfide bond formation protein DsbB